MRDKAHIFNVLPFIIGATVVISGLLWYAGQARQAPDETELLEGIVVAVVPSSRVLVLENSEGEQIGLALATSTRLFDEFNRTVELSYIRLGSEVSVQGTYVNKTTFIPLILRVNRR